VAFILQTNSLAVPSVSVPSAAAVAGMTSHRLRNRNPAYRSDTASYIVNTGSAVSIAHIHAGVPVSRVGIADSGSFSVLRLRRIALHLLKFRFQLFDTLLVYAGIVRRRE
jgi:hypothetical protein